MLTEKGNQVLMAIWIQFHNRYGQENPGCNENDTERAFLLKVLEGTETRYQVSTQTLDLIEKIR